MSSARPCPHMKTLLSALADGTLSGIARWYAENHAVRCPRCGEALASLRVLRDRLRTLGVPGGDTLSAERVATLEAALDRIDTGGPD